MVIGKLEVRAGTSSYRTIRNRHFFNIYLWSIGDDLRNLSRKPRQEGERSPTHCGKINQKCFSLRFSAISQAWRFLMALATALRSGPARIFRFGPGLVLHLVLNQGQSEACNVPFLPSSICLSGSVRSRHEADWVCQKPCGSVRSPCLPCKTSTRSWTGAVSDTRSPRSAQWPSRKRLPQL